MGCEEDRRWSRFRSMLVSSVTRLYGKYPVRRLSEGWKKMPSSEVARNCRRSEFRRNHNWEVGILPNLRTQWLLCNPSRNSGTKAVPSVCPNLGARQLLPNQGGFSQAPNKTIPPELFNKVLPSEDETKPLSSEQNGFS